VPALLDGVANQLRVTKRLAFRRGASFAERFGRLDDRFVFVVGSPRSGTTFLAGAIGSLPGFVDLGEVPAVKAAVPELAALEPADAARRLRRTLAVSRRAGLIGGVRPVEQTPEVAHILRALPSAFPEATIVHIVRDGRDVVCSLLEKPWLRQERVEVDDAGVPYGSYARFWVEPERRAEFETASDARRAAWVWRRYVSAVRSSAVTVLELRYETLAREPATVAATIAPVLGASSDALASAFAGVHASSVGRHHQDLTPEHRAEVEYEAGDLLRELGYL
jgi:hypothetical protein